jgi:hypothetical protein
MERLQNYGSELVIHLLDAAKNVERLTAEETSELLTDAAAVLCAFVHPEGCPEEAKAKGCTRPDFRREIG